jgi:hypothetical protein
MNRSLGRGLTSRLLTLDGWARGPVGAVVLSVLLVVLATAVAFPKLRAAPSWSSDGLFYWAQMLEVQGESAQEARKIVFSSPEAQATAEKEDHDVVRILDPTWVEYSAQFYRRRWTAPVLAAALEPIAGERSLRLAGALGYLALGPVMFLLLRRRFQPLLSACVSAVVLLLPPVVKWGVGTNGLGLTLLVASLLAASLVLDHGYVWLPAWMAAMVAMAFTRDSSIVVGFAILLLLLVHWRHGDSLRRPAALAATGVVACSPPLLLFRVPLRENFAYVIDGYRIPDDSSWSYVLHRYWPQLRNTVETNLRYPQELPLSPVIYVGLIGLALAVLYLLVTAPQDDPYFALARGSVIGAVVMLAIAVNPQGFRLELVLVPAVAIALAHVASRLWLASERRRPSI